MTLDHRFRAQAGVTGHALQIRPAVVHGDLHATIGFRRRWLSDRLFHESLCCSPIEGSGLGVEVQ